MSGDDEMPPGFTPLAHPGPWFVRQAGRQTGPFDLERVRTMARRGAITRMHSLSRDGVNWEPAARVHEVFNQDGTVASAGSSSPVMPGGPAQDDDAPIELGPDPSPAPAPQRPEPRPAPRPTPDVPAFGQQPASPQGARARATSDAVRLVSVRPVLCGALAFAMVALAVPTSRSAAGGLAWWWSEGAVGISVRGVSFAAVAAFWAIAFLRPDPIRATLACAAAAVLALVSPLPLWNFASWAIPAAALVPVSTILVAVATAGRSASGTAATAAIALAIPLSAASCILALLHAEPWALVGIAITCVGAAGTAFAALRVARRGSSDGLVLAGCIVGSAGGLGAVLASGCAGLAGDEPIVAARSAASGLIVVCLSLVAWAQAHEAVQTAHQVIPSDANAA